MASKHHSGNPSPSSGKVSASPELRAAAVEMLGELTVAAAFRDREALADMDSDAIAALDTARRALIAAAPNETQTVCLALPESTRRRLALLLLDGDFLQAVMRRSLTRKRA
jgi:hypothetical protein